MKYRIYIIALFGFIFTLNGCSNNNPAFIKSKCPYVKPVDVELRKNVDGGLNRHYTTKAYTALRYYGTETRRVEKLIKNEED